MNMVLSLVMIIALSMQLNSQTKPLQSRSTIMENGAIEQEVLDVVKKWNDTFEQNDPAAYFSFIHPDLTLFIPSSPYRIDCKQDDKNEFEWSLSTSRTKVHFFQELQPVVQIYGNTAIVTYHNRGAYGPDGTEQIHYLKETNVLVKENGKWSIVHIHVSK